MVKVKVIEDFHLGKFNELKNIIRANYNKKEEGRLYVSDIFECTEEMAKYLTGENKLKKSFVKVIEVVPERKVEDIEKKLTTRRRKRTIAKD